MLNVPACSPNGFYALYVVQIFVNVSLFRTDYCFSSVDASESGNFVSRMYAPDFLLNALFILLNVSFFRNHSCEPNCVCYHVSVEGQLRIALFTTKNVVYGEQLTWIYGVSFPFDNCLCATKGCSRRAAVDPEEEEVQAFQKTFLSRLIQACFIVDNDELKKLKIIDEFRFGGKALKDDGPLWLRTFCALCLESMHSKFFLLHSLLEFADRVLVSMRSQKLKRQNSPVLWIEDQGIKNFLIHFSKVLALEPQGFVCFEQQNHIFLLNTDDLSSSELYCVKSQSFPWFKKAFRHVSWHIVDQVLCKFNLNFKIRLPKLEKQEKKNIMNYLG